MSDDLVKLGAEIRRRALAFEDITTAESFIPRMADRIATLEAMLEAQDENCASLLERYDALIAAGDRLNELACHQDDCEIVTHGVWSDPIPCTCGYTEAWKAWKEARGDD